MLKPPDTGAQDEATTHDTDSNGARRGRPGHRPVRGPQHRASHARTLPPTDRRPDLCPARRRATPRGARAGGTVHRGVPRTVRTGRPGAWRGLRAPGVQPEHGPGHRSGRGPGAGAPGRRGAGVVVAGHPAKHPGRNARAAPGLRATPARSGRPAGRRSKIVAPGGTEPGRKSPHRQTAGGGGLLERARERTRRRARQQARQRAQSDRPDQRGTHRTGKKHQRECVSGGRTHPEHRRGIRTGQPARQHIRHAAEGCIERRKGRTT